MAKYDLKIINEVRKDYCELCGTPTTIWPHHIKPRGAGGKETRWNLIQLCEEHHRAVHDGQLHRKVLVEIVAKRENTSVEAIYDMNNWLYENKTPDELIIPNPIAGDTFEDILALYFSCLELGTNTLWDRAALITVMHDYMHLTPKAIASTVGCSASLCRKLIRTYSVFPSEQERIPVLSFRHHQMAAYTTEPYEWIKKAADNQWSTRVLQEEINQIQQSPQEIEEKEWTKAEKILLLVSEILEEENKISKWLRKELQDTLEKSHL